MCFKPFVTTPSSWLYDHKRVFLTQKKKQLICLCSISSLELFGLIRHSLAIVWQHYLILKYEIRIHNDKMIPIVHQSIEIEHKQINCFFFFLCKKWRCPWCNRYRHRIWTRRYEFNSWTRLIAFHIALIPLGNVWIQLFSLQLWVNSRAD